MQRTIAQRISRYPQSSIKFPLRSITTTTPRHSSKPPTPKSAEHSNPFVRRPGPPPLPPDEQKEFEELVRKAQAPLSSPKTHTTGSNANNEVSNASGANVDGVAEVVERHPDAPKRLPPEFEGDVNPVTGERGRAEERAFEVWGLELWWQGYGFLRRRVFGFLM